MRRFTHALAGVIALLAGAGSVAAEVTNIDSSQLQQLIDQGVPVIDVRTAPEWRQTGVIKGSHLITFFDAAGRYDAEAWLHQVGAVAGPDDPVIVICRTGNRTAAISNFLDQKAGYHKVYNMLHGIVQWIKDGNPTVAPTEEQDPE